MNLKLFLHILKVFMLRSSALVKVQILTNKSYIKTKLNESYTFFTYFESIYVLINRIKILPP